MRVTSRPLRTALALALAELSLDVVLIEAHPFGTFGQPSFDDRTTAISNGSRRIFEALRLLSETDTPVGQIGESLGFNSPAYFTRAFQNMTGVSPTSFRRSL